MSPPPHHPIENLQDIGREGFKSEDQREVTCAPSPAQSFRNTHSNTYSKGERRTLHGKVHRRTRQQAHTPPAKGQGSNPGSVCPYGEKTHYVQLPAPPQPQKGCGKYYLYGAPIRLKPVCDGTYAKHFGNLFGSIN